MPVVARSHWGQARGCATTPQLLGAASLPSPGASHDPAQAQQPHARGCRLVLAALKGANPVTAVGVVISTTGMAMAKREGAA